jgi:predicted GNAT superfamily acetyltransferase
VWGFPGFDERTTPPRLKHCSHQLGIHPDYRLSGLGFALKRRQWGFVRQQGLDLITWTYDPLMARNARLNIGKLGAVCSTYRRDEYGPLRDALNAGLPTDRFQVDWWLSSDRVTARMLGPQPPVPKLADLLAAGARLLNPPAPDGTPQPPEPDLTAALPETVLVEIPPDFLAAESAGCRPALAWRLGTRAAFEELVRPGLRRDRLPARAGPRAVCSDPGDPECTLTASPSTTCGCRSSRRSRPPSAASRSARASCSSFSPRG